MYSSATVDLWNPPGIAVDTQPGGQKRGCFLVWGRCDAATAPSLSLPATVGISIHTVPRPIGSSLQSLHTAPCPGPHIPSRNGTAACICCIHLPPSTHSALCGS